MQPTVIVDFSWIYHRAYHTFASLTFPSEGKLIKTGSMYGVIRDLSSLRKRFDKVKVAIEPKKNDKRYELVSEYKAGRKRPDDLYDLYQETIYAASCIPGVSVITSEESGEADDVIYSYIKVQGQEGYYDSWDVFYIFGNDKDLLQIVSEDWLRNRVFFFHLKNDEAVRFEHHIEKSFGVDPEGVLFFRSVVGDSSDNIASVVPRFPRKKLREFAKYETPSEFQNRFRCDSELSKDKHARLLIENYGKWKINYKIMKLQNLPIVEVKAPIGKDSNYFVKKYGMRSLRRFR